ncbi:MAG: ABC transporter permease [Alphaproteobacteria bacterium]|nr:MAG: ABC transporter permease [Alphaproteobacteria bacterium]
MTQMIAIAAAELRLMLRSRLALIGLAALLLLSGIAAVTSAVQTASASATRAAAQAATDEQFKTQPSRHPHRMVHYGTYALRPVGPLAAFDPGVDSFTGTVLFLEGHRQNSATFGAARESSDLVRFGQLTPAFVLQTLAPLLLVFLGFATVARERERGSLRALSAHGASAASILGGKVLALGGVALLAMAPALMALAWAALRHPGEGGIATLIALAYGVYLLVWVIGITAISALARTSQGALVTLLAIWAIVVVLVPRAAAGWAGVAEPLPSRVDTEFAIAADLRRMGDSHNPDDPHFAAFKQRILKQYGVATVDELPVNYRGLVGAEGERLTSELFALYAARADAIQLGQSARLETLGVLSPALAVRRASMVGAATDVATHLAFMNRAEAYRYQLIQRLNGLQVTQVSSADDRARSRDPLADQRTRISADFWKTMPQFQLAPSAPATRAAAMLPAMALLAFWLAIGVGLLWLARRNLDQTAA